MTLPGRPASDTLRPKSKCHSTFRRRSAANEMSELTWVDYAQGVGALLTPLVAAWIVYVLSRRQTRSHELLSARLDYYRQLIPDLNVLMCYMTFIGDWKASTPPEMVALKRRLDRNVFCAAPLFSPDVIAAYDNFMKRSFRTFNQWGQDATLLTSAYRRRPCLPAWDPAWDHFYAYADSQSISAKELSDHRATYDTLVGALVRDLVITRARATYTTTSVSLNAHAPRRDDIAGQPAA